MRKTADICGVALLDNEYTSPVSDFRSLADTYFEYIGKIWETQNFDETEGIYTLIENNIRTGTPEYAVRKITYFMQRSLNFHGPVALGKTGFGGFEEAGREYLAEEVFQWAAMTNAVREFLDRVLDGTIPRIPIGSGRLEWTGYQKQARHTARGADVERTLNTTQGPPGVTHPLLNPEWDYQKQDRSMHAWGNNRKY